VTRGIPDMGSLCHCRPSVDGRNGTL